jgi:predicted transcriptional regulator
MRVFWRHGSQSVREVLERLPGRRPAYTTVQTIVRRLADKGAVRNVRRVGNANVFEAAIEPQVAYRRLLDELIELFGGSPVPLVAHLIDTGRLDRDDLRAAEELLAKKR